MVLELFGAPETTPKWFQFGKQYELGLSNTAGWSLVTGDNLHDGCQDLAALQNLTQMLILHKILYWVIRQMIY